MHTLPFCDDFYQSALDSGKGDSFYKIFLANEKQDDTGQYGNYCGGHQLSISYGIAGRKQLEPY